MDVLDWLIPSVFGFSCNDVLQRFSYVFNFLVQEGDIKIHRIKEKGGKMGGRDLMYGHNSKFYG